MRVRAKVGVGSVNRVVDHKGEVTQENIRFFGVYSQDPDSENHKFWKATPSMNMEMFVTNPDIFGHFLPSQEYYLDFTLVEKPEAKTE